MHGRIDRQLLNPGGDKKSARVVAYYFHLQHAVHVGDPVVDPLEATAGSLDVAAENASEETTVEKGVKLIITKQQNQKTCNIEI